MKSFLAISFLIISLPSFASFNEVECTGKIGDKVISFEVEQAFPRYSTSRRANLIVEDNGSQLAYDYNLMIVPSHRNNIKYFGSGLTLDIDLWPDQSPRWGRNYRSELSSSDLGSSGFSRVNCTFPNVF